MSDVSGRWEARGASQPQSRRQAFLSDGVHLASCGVEVALLTVEYALGRGLSAREQRLDASSRVLPRRV